MSDQAKSLRLLRNRRSGAQANPARVLAITSGKGGVGKTNLAVNLGACLCDMGYRTALLDGDLGMANVDIVLGLNPPHNISDVVAGRKRLLDVAVTGPHGLTVFSGGSGLYEMANLNAWQMEHLAGSLAELDNICDVLIIDTGAGLSQGALRLLFSASEVIVVTTPEPTALADAYGVVKVVARRSPGTLFHIVVNMVKRAGEGETLYEHFQQAVHRFLQLRMNYLGHIPYDPNVSRCVLEQTLFYTALPGSSASQAVRNIAANLVGVAAPTAGGFKGLIARMAKLFQ